MPTVDCWSRAGRCTGTREWDFAFLSEPSPPLIPCLRGGQPTSLPLTRSDHVSQRRVPGWEGYLPRGRLCNPPPPPHPRTSSPAGARAGAAMRCDAMRAGGCPPRGSAPGSGGGQAPARAARPQVITAPPTCISSPGGKMRGCAGGKNRLYLYKRCARLSVLGGLFGEILGAFPRG